MRPDTAAIDPTRLDRFRSTFRGDVILPTDTGYDDARLVWNGMIDRRPALIVRPVDTGDIGAAIAFGRDSQLLIAVRGGGHSMPGYGTCDDGLVLDLSRMRGAKVDPVNRTARVNGGALLGELDAAAQQHGLVCPVGVVSHTGVGGLTLGGGMGRLQRKHGFTIDNLQAVEMVTADGRLVRASETENTDLFWAVRGAGANFGVVTAFEFGLHPFDGVLTLAGVRHAGGSVRDAWALFSHLQRTAPDHVMLAFDIGLGDEETVPDDLVGKPIVAIRAHHSGDPAAAEEDLKELMSFGQPVSSSIESKSYLEVQRSADDALSWGGRVYIKGGFTDEFPDDALEAMVDHMANGAATDSFGLWAQGGAVCRIPEDATAFTGHQARFQMSAECFWDDAAADESHISWARQAYAIVEPFSQTGRYVNDVSDSASDLGRWIYGDAKYDRLVSVKRAWDPDNVFRLNQNIRP